MIENANQRNIYPKACDEDSEAVSVCLLKVCEGRHGVWTETRDGGKRLNFRVLGEGTMDRTAGTRVIALPFRPSDTRFRAILSTSPLSHCYPTPHVGFTHAR